MCASKFGVRLTYGCGLYMDVYGIITNTVVDVNLCHQDHVELHTFSKKLFCIHIKLHLQNAILSYGVNDVTYP